MVGNVDYQEFRPAGDLADLVACTWTREAPALDAPPSARVVPDGCVDLIWAGGHLVVAGPDRHAFVSTLRPGERIVGLRLRPGTAGAVLGLPARELCGQRVPLDVLWGASAAALAGQSRACDPAANRRLLEATVLTRRGSMPPPDRLVLAVSRVLGRPRARVSSLCDEFGTSERQLLRRFDTAVGYGPKTLDRVLRFQRFLASDPATELARRAVELGYADQAHLTRDCLRLSGLTPSRLLAERAAPPARPAPRPATARTRRGAVH